MDTVHISIQTLHQDGPHLEKLDSFSMSLQSSTTRGRSRTEHGGEKNLNFGELNKKKTKQKMIVSACAFVFTRTITHTHIHSRILKSLRVSVRVFPL